MLITKSYFWSRVGCNARLLKSSCVGTNSERWWRFELLCPSVGAGASPAGISSAVVSRKRTTDLYALIDCSPVGICLQRVLLFFHNIYIFVGGEDDGYVGTLRARSVSRAQGYAFIGLFPDELTQLLAA